MNIGKKSTCPECQGATWFGGDTSDIPDILELYPQKEWCTCDPKIEVAGKEYPPQGPKADSWGKRKRELLRLTRDRRVAWARSFGVMGPGGVGLGPGL